MISYDFEARVVKESRRLIKPAEDTVSLELPSIRVDDVKLVKQLPGM